MGGDIRGGGLSFIESNTHINPSLIHSEGLRVPRVDSATELDGLQGTGTYGKKKSYDRVSIY